MNVGNFFSSLGFLKELKDTVPLSKLPKKDCFVYKLLKDDLDVFINGFKWRYHSTFNAVNFLETIPIDFMSFLIDTTRFSDLNDFKMYHERLQQIPRQIMQQQALMELAMEKGTTLHR